MALSANLIADFSSFLEATRESVAAMRGFKETAEELGPATDRGLEVTEKQMEAAGQAARRLGADIRGAADSFIEAYAESQEAVNDLTVALQASGNATPEVMAAYAAMAAELQKTTRFSDDALTKVQTTLTTIGHVAPEQMGLALQAVTSLANGMNMDLGAAANLVAKAVGTGGESLGRLKVAMGDVEVKGKSTAEILELINGKFAGANQTDMQNYSSQVENLKNQMGEFDEQIGGVLVANLQTLLGLFQSIPEPIQTMILAVVGIGTALAPVLVSLSSLVSILATPAIAGGLTAALSALLPFLGPVGLIAAGVAAIYAVWKNWDSIKAIISGIYEAAKRYLVDGLVWVANQMTAPIRQIEALFTWLKNTLVGHSIVPDMINLIAENFSRLDSVMVDPTKNAISVSQELWKEYQGMFGGFGRAGMIGGGVRPEFLSWAAEQASAFNLGGATGGPTPGLAPGVFTASALPSMTVNITMNGVLSANDPQTKQTLKDLVGEALADAMRGQRLLSTA